MKHVGDITTIHGYDLEPVDVICGGSPCQDLSVAGKRAGLAGERSGLFMEQIRIIKEMRENDRNNGYADELCRPRFAIKERVMSERTRCCCNCRHNMRCDLPEGIQCFCEVDGHWMGYIECMTGWCRRWASDRKEWKDGRPNRQTEIA